MLLENLDPLEADAVARLFVAFASDTNPRKMDLGIGVYRDEGGSSPILKAVRDAEQTVLRSQTTKEYLPPSGNVSYCRAIETLVLGDGHPVLAADRLRSVQTPGGGGALRAALELVKELAPNTRVWVSGPTWRHHHLVIDAVGLETREFPYYDTDRNELLFNAAVSALQALEPGDVILLQGCCHNPTGEDLSAEQWDDLTRLIHARGAVPVVDLAYQGFGDGLEEDAYGVRRLAASVPEMFIASTSSKSFGIYRDRAGALSVLLDPDASNADHLVNHLVRITRGLYFMPPDHGASIVAHVLGDPCLKDQWLGELEGMRRRIVALRHSLSAALTERTACRDFDYLARQKGMFSLLPLREEDARTLESQWSVYMMPGRRINFAALTEQRVSYLARAIAAVYTFPRQRVIHKLNS